MVKTRLAQAIGVSAALAAYKLLVECVVNSIAQFQDIELRYTPDNDSSEIQRWLQPGWQSHPQGAGDLGIRLHRAFEEAFASGAERVAIIGSDCPYLGVDDIATAWARLADHDVVLGPAADGGYWLVALRQAHPQLFQDISWSTSKVLAETRFKATQSGLRVCLLRELIDVDTEKDWLEFVRSLRKSRSTK
jgi:rSAM/selenodomain-associated transferase 1